jgi:hypothetical protein
MKRRTFINTGAVGLIGMALPFGSCVRQGSNGSDISESTDYRIMMQDLLKQWCDGMLQVQISDPEHPEFHGALGCPACDKIHGRCMDAVFPFLHMADISGEVKYLEAGIAVFEWADNVSMPDGSWTVIPDPTSWKGITVFGAIALAEALHYHGHLLDKERRANWTERLGRAGDFIYKNFTTTYSNINYAATAVYGLNLLGRVLDRPEYLDRSRELAGEVKKYFILPNNLLYGEGKPIDKKSPRGLLPVDLGYNVEESLSSLVLYALEEKDEEMLSLLTRSLEGHLEFMLPDGGWDNSWGTRQFKWTYWGSRTCDGCQPAYGLMAHINPVFGTAAYLNTNLLQKCSGEGLLYGGLHYDTHGIKPCVHHTFAHSKALATMLNMGDKLPEINTLAVLPRVEAKGVKEFKEVSTWLISKGPWRGTVSSYDWIYKEHAQQASGGALSVLYHNRVGLLLTASMAKYMMVEANNQQVNPGEDFALTPRIESYRNGKWYTNLYDLEALVRYDDTEKAIRFEIDAELQSEDREKLSDKSGKYHLIYNFESDKVELRARTAVQLASAHPATLVIPVVSPTGEKVTQVDTQRIEIEKPGGVVVLEANVPLIIKKTSRSRVFNMVPGAEVVPIIAEFGESNTSEIICTIKVI